MGQIPQSVYDLAEYRPVEDVVLPILRPRLGGVPVYSLIPDGADELPFVLVRRNHTERSWQGDERGWLDMAYVTIHTLTQDPDGDEQGAVLSEAVRVVLRDAARKGWATEDGVRLSTVQLVSEPRRVADWATATGPVQYADLPTGTWRYEALYRMRLRYRP